MRCFFFQKTILLLGLLLQFHFSFSQNAGIKSVVPDSIFHFIKPGTYYLEKNSNIFFKSPSSQSSSLLPEIISIKNESDIHSKRENLIDYIFGTAGWPSIRVPNQIYTDIDFYDNRYVDSTRSSYNLATIDQYNIFTIDGFTYRTFLFHPIVSNNKLFVYVGGHGWGVEPTDRGSNDGIEPGIAIPELLKKGYTVLAVSMPLQGDSWGMDTIAGQGQIDWLHASSLSHEQMFQYFVSPYSYFFYHIVVSLNYIQDNYNFSDYYMTGLSGGGWTTTLYSAIDTRIRFSFPVAGTTPLYLREQVEGLGDIEQGYDYSGLYGIANYEELYIMGAYGQGRGQMQILNQYDACCYYGNTRYIDWVDSVRLTLKALGQGTYNFYLDTTHHEHKMSMTAINEIFSFICYYEDTARQMSLPFINNGTDSEKNICEHSSLLLSAHLPDSTYACLWQINYGNGYQTLINDTLFVGVDSVNLLINSSLSILNGSSIRYVVTADCYPTTFSLPIVLNIVSPDTATSAQVFPIGDKIVCVNSSFTYTAQTVGTISDYIWQADFGFGFNNLEDSGLFAGTTTPNLIISEANDSVDGARFRCIISSPCFNNDTSGYGVLQLVHLLPSIIEQPEEQIVEFGSTAFFSVTAIGNILSYEWQADFGNGYYSLIDSSMFSGVDSPELSVIGVNLDLDNVFFRCIVTGPCGADTSSSVKLGVIFSLGYSNAISNVGINMQVYPNPSSGDFGVYFSLYKTTELSIAVYDQSGKIIFYTSRKCLTGNNYEKLLLDGFKEGVYIVTIKEKDVNASTPILIRKE